MNENEIPKGYVRESDIKLQLFDQKLDYIKSIVDELKTNINNFFIKKVEEDKGLTKCLNDHEIKLKNNLFQTKLQWWAIAIILVCLGTGILIIISLKTGINTGR